MFKQRPSFFFFILKENFASRDSKFTFFSKMEREREKKRCLMLAFRLNIKGSCHGNSDANSEKKGKINQLSGAS